MSKKKTKRFLKFEGTDKELEISKATKINGSKKEFMMLEKMKDGSWRLTWTDTMFDDLSDISCIHFIRDD